VHYVRQGKTADQAIHDQLDRLGKAAQNWTVVSSDRQVKADARAHHAALLSSEQFASQLQSAHLSIQAAQKEDPETPGADELDEWLRLFGNTKK